MPTTTIESIRNHVRALIGDDNPTVYQYQSDQIDGAIRTTVSYLSAMGKFSDDPITLSTDGTKLVRGDGDDGEAISAFDTDTQKFWGLIVWGAAVRFIGPRSSSYSYNTRALSEHFGDNKEQVFQLLSDLYMLECSAGGE